MDILKIDGVRVAGIVACLPARSLDNREACRELYGDGVDTLIKATGILKRRVVEPGTTALDLYTRAAEDLLQKTGTAPEEIGAIVCVTFTPAHLMPADAPAVQARLGVPNGCLAFDVNMACSGYGYGLYLGATIARQMNKKVLVLDGDIQSAFVSVQDKATLPVLSDAGTATLLEPDAGAAPWSFGFYTDGSDQSVLLIPAGGSQQPTKAEDIELREYEDGSRRRNTDLYMDGFAIFKFVAMTASRFIREFMEQRSLTAENIDVFVPHQANIYMITQLTKKLKIPAEKMWKSGDIYGNPGSTSVPLTIAENAGKWFAAGGGKRTLLSGFGGGLSITVADIELNSDGVYSVIEYQEK